jgi:MarR family transcriptional regulator, transcriptional regulator for hemolysin
MSAEFFPDQPFGKMLTLLGKTYLQSLRSKLAHLEIDRYYYAVFLIGKHDGEITQTELAELLESDKVTIVRTVDYLSEKGYVKRGRNRNDRRKYSLSLTPKALESMPEIRAAFADLNQVATRGLNEEQIAELDSMIKKIKNNLSTYAAGL